MSNAAAEKAAADLKDEQATPQQFEDRVSKIKQELKDATHKCKLLEEENKVKATELTKALQDTQEARSESTADREELRQARQIAVVQQSRSNAKHQLQDMCDQYNLGKLEEALVRVGPKQTV